MDLPPRDVANALVERFFAKVHCDFPIFHRALFQETYESMWSPEPDTSPAWLMVLSMVFVLALEAPSGNPLHSQFSSRREGIMDRYVGAASRLLPDIIAGSRLVHVQGLMLYCLHLHLFKERNVCWNVTGVAIRIATSIGLHSNEAHDRCTAIERELRKRIWWTLYSFERLECSSLGRPSAIEDWDLSLTVPAEGLLDMGDIFPVGLIDAQSRLMIILGNISKSRVGLGAPDAPSNDQAHPDQVRLGGLLAHLLDAWHAELPPHLTWSPQLLKSHHRAVLLLHTQYYYARTLLSRNVLAARVSGRETDIPAAMETPWVRDCVDSAKKSAQLLQRLVSCNQFNSKTWWDVYFVEATSVVLVLAALVDDPAVTGDDGEIMDAIYACMGILECCDGFSPTTERFSRVSTLLMQAVINARAAPARAVKVAGSASDQDGGGDDDDVDVDVDAVDEYGGCSGDAKPTTASSAARDAGAAAGGVAPAILDGLRSFEGLREDWELLDMVAQWNDDGHVDWLCL